MVEAQYLELPYLKNFHHSFLAGCDEVGRGPLAGPVGGACVTFSPETPEEGEKGEEVFSFLRKLGVQDSKSLNQ